jgi:dynactin-4
MNIARAHSDLRPLRIPLQTKKTKRCGVCKHILIKPEQKAQSVRYKIKLVAANYIPAIAVALPPPPPSRTGGTTRNEQQQQQSGLHAGRTYPFTLALTNPLYDPIQVRLTVQRQLLAAQAEEDKARRPPFAVSLPAGTFGIAAFAEAWEYEDEDEEMFGLEEEEAHAEARGGGRSAKTVGVLERKANVTVVGGEVVIGKSAKDEVKVCFIVACSILPLMNRVCSSICWCRTPIARTTPSQRTTTSRGHRREAGRPRRQR